MNRFLILAALFVLTACAAPQKKYEWGSYEQSLYEYYKAPANLNALVASIDATIVNAEKANRPVPPGVYAEYGFLLLQQGKHQEAAGLFTKEKARWPESASLMNKMIKLAETKSTTTNEVKQ
ncbi:DUF4810 domain-containing protein [Pseudoduganella umbonata]|uniref:DUF4810 domain-containing protein n=1 Tax=Pseudoduganella umbonata TaxID=864828 RepID=A0A4P8HQ18_9BURK|nr:DUF4810 domain-containing protein [Pseudoduganella umbonata]MBB3224416.1 hypothetical protein [Pseudoduganella umbonata]QCP11226.1 DUF4810 domain-containing protein [Pseudoduganella umbonata]